MSVRFWSGLLSIAAVASIFAARAQAQETSLDSCGDIYVEARAECVVVPPSAECKLMCEPLRLEAACAAELKVECDAQCRAEFDVGCSGTCEASCQADCTGDPGEFDCQAYCQVDCGAECMGECQASANQAQCQASCKATCSADCDASCRVRPPQVDCQADCRASCQGSCRAKANIDCQANCQADGFVRCEADLQGGCEGACETQEGALFCQGQYVDTGNNLEECVEALRAKLNVDVEYYADAGCDGGVCTAEAGGSAKCSALPGAQTGGTGAGILLAGLAAVVVRRRRPRASSR